MKQPLMIIPPAQAEALYDEALEAELETARRPLLRLLNRPDDWQDDTEDGPQAGLSRPAVAAGRHQMRGSPRPIAPSHALPATDADG